MAKELYQAPIVVLAMIFLWVVKRICHELEDKKKKTLPLWVHHYTWTYILLAVLYIIAVQEMFLDIMGPSGWLDSAQVEAGVIKHMCLDQNKGANCVSATLNKGSYDTWKKEASLEEYPWLVYFSLTSPIWMFLTLVVCGFHTFKHVQQIKRAKEAESRVGRRIDTAFHDWTTTILALPAFYGLMAFKSVERMWQVVVDHVGESGAHQFGSWTERKGFLEEMYDSNFMVGDIYETYALVTFGQLIMGVLINSIAERRLGKQSEEEKEEMSIVEKLEESMKGLTVAGVKLFAYTCLAQGSYTLIVTSMSYLGLFPGYFDTDPKHPGFLQQPWLKAKVSTFFYGCGTVASCAAINNIMTVEKDFHSFLHHFKPSPKFWGTKVLVTLAFLQTILLGVVPPFNSWSTVRSDLFYASVLTCECFIIALLHIRAWSEREGWYCEDYEGKTTNECGPAVEAREGLDAPFLEA
eukprot:NODE_359_length_1636_cov_392.094877.p2 GENE.NODE_359_length_1636_cov_392.094877~~NODE_359_length_1636_cov_392.094877.p2  ORF type:complete len:465 (-),score=166.05 NODE_359_length_1636_cov_392.094877:136-1530(-)